MGSGLSSESVFHLVECLIAQQVALFWEALEPLEDRVELEEAAYRERPLKATVVCPVFYFRVRHDVLSLSLIIP